MVKIPLSTISKGAKVAKTALEIKYNISDFNKKTNLKEKFTSELDKNLTQTKKYESRHHPRKLRYEQYKSEILPKINDMSREILLAHRMEVNEKIEQVQLEKDEKSLRSKLLCTKRINNWKNIKKEIDGTIKTRDYLEYLKLYNNPDRNSFYFENYEKHLQKYKEILRNNDTMQIKKFVHSQTGVSKENIESDFGL